MAEQAIQLDPRDRVPEPDKKVTIHLQSADGKEIGKMGFDRPMESISMLVAQTQMFSGGKPRAFAVSNSRDAAFFTISSWDPSQRILTAKLKK